MTTPTTSTTTAAPATGTTATAAAGQGTTATTADPAAGSLFTAILQSLGGPALTAGTTAPTTGTAGEEALPGETEEGTTEDGTAIPALAVDPSAALAALVPTALLVPAPAAETALPTGGDALEGVIAAPALPAIALADDTPTVTEIPVAVTAATTVAVADALPTTPAPADEPVAEAAPIDGGSEDGEGVMPLPTTLAATAGTTPATTAQTAAAAAAAQAAHAAPVATAQAATAAPAEPTTAVAPTGDRPERKERASASDAVAAAPTAADGQATTTATVAVTGGATTTTDTLKAEAAAGSLAHVDRERFERLADGLAARLRVSLAGDGARVRMHLTPRELGEVVVRLELKDGKAHAHLIADSADASRMLTSAMGDLRNALADRGLRLDTVNVRVSGDAGGPMHGHTGTRQDGHGQQKTARTPFGFGRLEGLQAPEAALATGEPAQHGVSVLA